MIGVKIDQAKGMFFDAPKIVRSVDAATRKVLSKFGAYVRTAARSSIRTRKKVSEPGSPPSSHTGLLKKFIYFGYDESRQSVVVGPTRLGSGVVPERLEYGYVGGDLARMIHRKVGDGGEIEINGRPCRTTKKNRYGAMVTYTKLRTQAQADRANQLQRLLYKGIRATLSPRPYMHPALNQELPKLPAMWRDSVKP